MTVSIRRFAVNHRKLAIVPLVALLVLGTAFVRPQHTQAAQAGQYAMTQAQPVSALTLAGPAGTTYSTNGGTCTTEFNNDQNTRWTQLYVFAPTVKKRVGMWPTGARGEAWYRIWWKENGTWKSLDRTTTSSRFNFDGVYEYLVLPNLNYYLPTSLQNRTLYVQTAVVLRWNNGGFASMNYVDEQLTTKVRQNYPIGMGNYAWSDWATAAGCLV